MGLTSNNKKEVSMCHVVVIGAGITGVTTAYELSQLGYQVTVVDRHLFPAMETSFANGGQLSACNAEVWNQKSTVLKGMKWMSQKSAPLLLNPAFSVHKYAWLMEFLGNIKHYEANTHETVRLALLARQRLFEIADKESIDFNLEKRGILHFYHNKQDYDVAIRVNDLLNKGGLERSGVSNEEIKQIEPTLTGDYYAGFYCEGDATGDIHKYTTGLAEVTKKLGVKYRFGMDVTDIQHLSSGVEVKLQPSSENVELLPNEVEMLAADAVVVCAGVGDLAGKLSEMFEATGNDGMAEAMDAVQGVMTSVSNIGRGFAEGGVVGGIAAAGAVNDGVFARGGNHLNFHSNHPCREPLQ
jgi:D-amino-acid dehydrogenase